MKKLKFKQGDWVRTLVDMPKALAGTFGKVRQVDSLGRMNVEVLEEGRFITYYSNQLARAEKLECSPEQAQMFLEWIFHRGGIAVWNSANKADYRLVSRPIMDDHGNRNPKMEGHGRIVRVVRHPSDVNIIIPKEVDTFSVGVYVMGKDFRLKPEFLKKIREAEAKARMIHGDAWYHITDITESSATVKILVFDKSICLNEWKRQTNGDDEDVLQAPAMYYAAPMPAAPQPLQPLAADDFDFGHAAAQAADEAIIAANENEDEDEDEDDYVDEEIDEEVDENGNNQ